MPPLNISNGMVDTVRMTAPPPSEMEVDYDKNITSLYESITSCEWDKAIATAKEYPKQAQTWVVRHYDKEDDSDEPPEIMWRFLPIHSACARQPPAPVISALIKAYPDGAKCVDDQGMYPLHYACGNQASREVIRLLLVAFPQAAKIADPRGMLPIHYLACWGPSSTSIIDMILVANRDVSDAKDADGNTALELALEGEYAERDAVVASLRRWLEKGSSSRTSRRSRSPAPKASRSPSHPVHTVSAEGRSDTDREEGRSDTETDGRLRSEIAKLKNEIRHVEEEKEKETADLRSKAEELETTLETVKDELAREKASTDEFAAELQEKEELLMSTEDRLAEATQNLVSTEDRLAEVMESLASLEEERDQLNEEVNEVAEQRDHCQKKLDNTNDRLGSLTASLTSMAETQADLTADLQDREARLHSASEVRRAKLQAMMDFETQLVMTTQGGGEDGNFAAEFETQQKEMDAIAAVITAMRH